MRMIFAIAGLCFAIAACLGPIKDSPARDVDLKALQWISSDADRVDHLTQQPATCLKRPDDASVQRGELLFNSPLLLGGQAAKAGLSCGSCHRNGRGNLEFVFVGISGAPGTADVTSGLFSKVRADQVFNPIAIPDLALPHGQINVDRTEDDALEAFLAAQITEEFSGEMPESNVVADVSAYLRALDAAACDAGAKERQTWRDEIRRLRAGASYIDEPDHHDSAPYRAAMRASLGRLFERYAGNEFDRLRQSMISLSRDLANTDYGEDLQSRLDALETNLAAGEAQSLYDRERLKQVLP
ncbi:MAG: hypothetical protein ACE37M_09040 [Henriciella sp.]